MKKSALLLLLLILPFSLFSLGSKENVMSPKTVRERNEILDYVKDEIYSVHPNPFSKNDKEVWDDSFNKLKSELYKLDDLAFAFRLSEIVSLANDSHTQIPLTSSFDINQLEIVPVNTILFDTGLAFTLLPKGYKEYLGLPISKINNVPLNEITKRLSKYISSDNETRLEYQVRNLMFYKPILDYINVTDKNDSSLLITFEDGREIELDFIPYSKSNIELVKLKEKDSFTDANKDNYFLLFDDNNTAYIQYNKCQNYKDFPFSSLVEELKEKPVDSIIIDFRNNDGGSDGVISPLYDYLEENKDVDVYVLIGSRTFSSAVINVAFLKTLFDATLIGTPTGGSADHFGSVKSKRLSNNLVLQISTKEINLDGYLNSDYGWKEIYPNYMVYPTVEDYKNGVDTSYNFALNLITSKRN